MTALECLKILRKGFIFLLVWNVVLSFCLVAGYMEKQTEELNQKICNLEAIPEFDLVEVE
jgi:hypothetical protein